VTTSDVFISYSSQDNREPPNWVIELKDDLLRKMSTYDAHLEPVVWCDEKIESGELFDAKIQAAVEGARILLCVVSPNYAKSDWCRREVNLFCGKPGAKERVVKLKKLPLVLEEILPEPLPGMEEVRFYEEPKQLDDRPRALAKEQREDRALEIAWHLAKLIRAARNPKGRVVILADPERDADRRFLCNEILESGYEVHPRSLPNTPELRRAALESSLSRATFTVLLFGSTFSPDLEFALDYLGGSRQSNGQSAVPRVHCLSSVLARPMDQQRVALYERLQTPLPGFSYTSESRPSVFIKEYLAQLESNSRPPTLFLCSSADHRLGIESLQARLAQLEVLDPLAALDPPDVLTRARSTAHAGLIYADEDQPTLRRLRTLTLQTLPRTRNPALVGVYPSSPQVSFDVNDLRGFKLILPDDLPPGSPLASVAERVVDKLSLAQFVDNVRQTRDNASRSAEP